MAFVIYYRKLGVAKVRDEILEWHKQSWQKLEWQKQSFPPLEPILLSDLYINMTFGHKTHNALVHFFLPEHGQPPTLSLAILHHQTSHVQFPP